MFDKIIVNKNNDEKIPWVEKYKPKDLDEIVGQEKTINSLKNLVNTKNMPHLLFYGPPGTGKTSAILSIAKEIYGIENIKNRIIILNASQERGIKVVREKIKSFACNTISKSDKLPPYKIIILDEADTITNDAQTALRRSMETYSHITRFCIICNYVTKIIEPITSRCALYKFDLIKLNIFDKKIKYICDNEGLELNSNFLNLLFKLSEGDLRKGINMLQYSSLMSNNGLNEEQLLLVSGEYDDEKMIKFIEDENKDFKKIHEFTKDLLLKGNSSESICASLLRVIRGNKIDLDEILKAKIGIEICKCDKKMSNGSSEYLNLLNIFLLFL